MFAKVRGKCKCREIVIVAIKQPLVVVASFIDTRIHRMIDIIN